MSIGRFLREIVLFYDKCSLETINLFYSFPAKFKYSIFYYQVTKLLHSKNKYTYTIYLNKIDTVEAVRKHVVFTLEIALRAETNDDIHFLYTPIQANTTLLKLGIINCKADSLTVIVELYISCKFEQYAKMKIVNLIFCSCRRTANVETLLVCHSNLD